MWTSTLHLVFGNAIIGVIEGILLGALFKTSKVKAVLVLIIANYTSAWVGGFAVTQTLPSLIDFTLCNIKFWFLVFVVTSFLLTLLLELPFVWGILRNQKCSLRKAFKATTLIHGVSYTVLFVLYWSASGTSIMTQLQVVSPNEIKLPTPFNLYYITPKGDDVLGMNLNTPNSIKHVAKIAPPYKNSPLYVRVRATSGYDLVIPHPIQTIKDPSEDLLILENFSTQSINPLTDTTQVPSLIKESDWTFYTGFWAIEGISGQNKKTGERFKFSLELPFVKWYVSDAAQITEEHIILLLGGDQICLIHLPSKRIALITRGSSPIVAL